MMRWLQAVIGTPLLLGLILSPTLTAHLATSPPLGPVPRGCRYGSAPQIVPSLYLPAVGFAPIWAVGFRPNVPVHVATDMAELATAHGWPMKIAWVEHRNYNHVVTIRAWTWPQRQMVWFTSHTEGQRPYLRLDPQHPTLYPPVNDPQRRGQVIPNPHWKGFSSAIFIPHAGCYVMEARWPGGMWHISFAAGR